MIRMNFQVALVLVFSICILSALGKSTEEQRISTAAILKKELERFASIKKAFEEVNLNVKVLYTYPFKDESESLLKLDTIEIRPAFFYNNPEGPKLPDKYDADKIKAVFATANKWNLTAVGSREIFDADGVLQEKEFITEEMTIHLKDENTHVVFYDDSDFGDDDEEPDDIQDYVNFMKDFELPVSIEVKNYDESGEVTKTDTALYEPKKVRIINTNMFVLMQMKVAEALKRTCSVKNDPKKRIMLLCRFLGIQYPRYTFNAVIGEGSHKTMHDRYLKAEFDGSVYTVYGIVKEVEID